MQLQATTIDSSLSVSHIVRNDYRTADVFKALGINYCCGGNLSLTEACAVKGIALDAIYDALDKATNSISLPNNIQFDNWKPDFLIDYISHVHHAYLLKTIPALTASFTTYAEGHKKKFPELQGVLQIFQQLADILISHTKQEEEIIFPYLKQIINTHRRKETYGSLFVKTMRKPLSDILEKEHKQIAGLLLQLRAASHNYNIPTQACTNYGVYLHKLKELDTDLVQHKHLENNILFPKVISMEKELLQL